jgi:hypothetical protein
MSFKKLMAHNVLQWQSQKHRCHGFRDTAKVL